MNILQSTFQSKHWGEKQEKKNSDGIPQKAL